jgi:hypothetical protein
MSTITITCGEQAENQRGMQVIGNKHEKGYSKKDLEEAKAMFEDRGFKCELYDLNEYLDEPSEEAAVLVVFQGINCLLQNTGFMSKDLMKEMGNLKWDKKALMYGKVVNKHARYNICFGDEPQEPEYEQGKGRIVPWKDIPVLSVIRARLGEFLVDSKEMVAEGNFYYDSSKCGVCFHGDDERKKVVGLRLSTGGCPAMHYQWFKNKQPIGQRAIIPLEDGDLYIMSEKASGNDEKKTLIPTLKHATGAPKFTTL